MKTQQRNKHPHTRHCTAYTKQSNPHSIPFKFPHLDFGVTGPQGKVLAGLVPLERGDVGGLRLHVAEVVDAVGATSCVQQVDRASQGNGQVAAFAPIKQV